MGPKEDNAGAAGVDEGPSLQAVQEATKQLSELRQQLHAQRQLREANLSPARLDDSALARLDSSIKKNSAFIKRLKQQLGDEAGHKALLADVLKLNLSKYVSEAVSAVAEAPLRLSEVPAAVAVCSLLHQRYTEFGPALGPALAKAFASKAGGGEEDRALLRRQRSSLRLLGEVLAVGVVAEAGVLLRVVRELSAVDFKKDREAAKNAVSLLGSFAKTARTQLIKSEPAGALPIPEALLQQPQDGSSMDVAVAEALRRLQQEQEALQEEAGKRWWLSEADAAQLQRALDRTFEAASAALLEEHAALAALEKENARLMPTEAGAAEYEARRKSYEALVHATTALAEALGRPMPPLPEGDTTRMSAADSSSAGQQQAEGPFHVFEDPELRAFYTSLPDLRSLVPAVLLGDAPGPQGGGGGDGRKRRSSDGSGKGTGTASGGAAAAGSAAAGPAAAAGASAVDAAAAAQTAGSAEAAAGTAGAEDKPAPAAAEPSALSTHCEPADGDSAAEAAGTAGEAGTADAADKPAASAASTNRELELILGRLPTCVSRDLCDELSVNFCYCNGKGPRKRLVRALSEVPRGRLQLLPYYARVAATLSQVYPEVGQGVLASVEAEFDAMAAKKDPNPNAAALEARLRCSRYLGELVKFRIAPMGPTFLRLKGLLDDFSGANIDAACALVESAGRFLIRTPESKVRMENLLEVMMRLKNARNLDSRHAAAIDSAYFATRPPAGARGVRRRQRPPLHEYVRHLVFEELGEDSIVVVLKQLMKLPWEECERYVLKCLLKVVRMRASHIPLVASLAGGLAPYHDSLGVGLVDAVMEDVRWGLDHPNAGMYQKRLADCRLLAELYNYMLLDSAAVFDMLYLLISHAHGPEEGSGPDAKSRLDPPDDFFRIRMIITLLQSCGQYFKKGAARRRLDCYLTFLQAYILSKSLLPLDVEFDLEDLLATLRPELKRFSSYEEAATAAAAILEQEAAAVARGLPPIDEEEDSDDEDDDRRAGGARAESIGAESEGATGSGGDGEDVDEYDRGGDDGAQANGDDEFEREYAALLQEYQGPKAAATPALAPMLAPVAAPVLMQQGPRGGQASSSGAAGGDGGGSDHGYVESIPFKMLLKKGGKADASRELQVPITASIAVSLLAREESEAAERSQIKRLVLAANKRDEAEQLAAAHGGQQQQGGRGGAAGRGDRGGRGGRGGGQKLYYRRGGPAMGSGRGGGVPGL